ncbi:hypothetical protein MWN41_11130 [Ornithobacterium rhinotracheale]|uniref:hypothetical protein n=1 Tax=Ornithobacterium rhinotracheale TaxID=28251 RepID=UPI001FF1DDC5|nr:hypothetical protein [Ornithobacterium rhinotracheale]MCK0203566.1 hypothetical protein [Ornithobacterium rhinotracheale]
MKKITIKSFLNKRVKPIQVYSDIEENGYPLYYSITYDRRTQNMRSLTGAVMTEKAFKHLKQTGEPLHRETNYQSTDIQIRLSDELGYLNKAVEFIVTERKITNIFNSYFTEVLKGYFNRLQDELYHIGWLDYYHNPKNFIKDRKERYKKEKHKPPMTAEEIISQKIELDPEEKRMLEVYKNHEHPYYEMEQLYYSFNSGKNLLLGINQVEKITGVDIKKYFFEDTLKYWYVINLVLRSYNDIAVKIDFILDFKPNKYIELNKKLKYPVSDDEIILIANELKQQALLS